MTRLILFLGCMLCMMSGYAQGNRIEDVKKDATKKINEYMDLAQKAVDYNWPAQKLAQDGKAPEEKKAYFKKAYEDLANEVTKLRDKTCKKGTVSDSDYSFFGLNMDAIDEKASALLLEAFQAKASFR